MKTCKVTHRWWFNLFVIAVALLATNSLAMDTNTVRLAIGPFFAPQGNEPLQKVVTMLPDLLTVKLSGQNHFQLVERQKISEVWGGIEIDRKWD